MNRVSLTSRDRRALLLGAIIVLPAVLVPLVVKPYLRALSAYREDIADEQTRLVRERKSIAALPTTGVTYRTTSDRLEHEVDRLFQANNDLSAIGDLSQYVERIAQTTGIQLQQAETQPVRLASRDLHALPLAVRVLGNPQAIFRFLRQLETGNKLVRIDNLSINVGSLVQDFRGPVGARGMPGVGGMPNDPSIQGEGRLSVSANIYGYRLSDASWQSVGMHSAGAPSLFARAAIIPDTVLNGDLFHVASVQSPLPDPRTLGPQEPWKPPVPPFHLVGTVTSANDVNFAVIKKASAPVQTVFLGAKLDDYVLSELRPNFAVLTGRDGTRVELQANQPGGPQNDLALSKNGAQVQIVKDPTGNLQVSVNQGEGQSGMISFTGPQNDTVYAQVSGPADWQGDPNRFMLSTDGKGNCCRQIPMTVPGNYVYRIWDQVDREIGQGSVIMERR